MEKISVIIPTYNRAEKIRKSIESVLQQTYTDLEIIVVDDGSEDDTREVVETIQDRRIQYVRLAFNQGAAAARNEGVRLANYPLIAFQDSDDIWRPEKLERQIAYWTEHPYYAMVYCPYLKHHITAEEHQGDFQKIAEKNRMVFEGDIFLPLLIRNSIGTPSMLLRKECFQKVGGFDTELRSLEDWDFAIRFSEKYAIGYINEILVDVYPSEGSVSSGVGAYYDSRCRMIAKYKDKMEENGVLDLILGDLLCRAEKRGVLEIVKKMLLVYIEGRQI